MAGSGAESGSAARASQISPASKEAASILFAAQMSIMRKCSTQYATPLGRWPGDPDEDCRRPGITCAIAGNGASGCRGAQTGDACWAVPQRAVDLAGVRARGANVGAPAASVDNYSVQRRRQMLAQSVRCVGRPAAACSGWLAVDMPHTTRPKARDGALLLLVQRVGRRPRRHAAGRTLFCPEPAAIYDGGAPVGLHIPCSAERYWVVLH